ncbi:MAG: hypothetical protein HUJ26_23910 [Planctomycetaceae bacterium]|nr:hypothetical protein [Planctomycetaceae bacterium]
MSAQDSNESGDRGKDILPFDPTKWYSGPELMRVLRIGKHRLNDWKRNGLKRVPLKPEQFWGGDVHEFLMKLRE